MAYATRAEVYALGLDAQAFSARPRALESVDPSTGILTLAGNGLSSGGLLRFVAEGAPTPGHPSADLPAGLNAVTMYTAAPVSGSSDLFRVAPVGGSTITSFGDAGAGAISIVIDPGYVLDEIAEKESRFLDQKLTAHDPPMLPDPMTGQYPGILVLAVATRTAIRGALRLGAANPTYKASLDGLIADQARIDGLLADWIEGRPINGRPLDQNTIPDDAPRAMGRAPIGWGRRTL